MYARRRQIIVPLLLFRFMPLVHTELKPDAKFFLDDTDAAGVNTQQF